MTVGITQPLKKLVPEYISGCKARQGKTDGLTANCEAIV
jgi:hypothetical protein